LTIFNSLHMSHDLKEMPVFQKANSIVALTKHLVNAFDEEKDELKLGEIMLSNASIIPAKIAGAEAGDLYSLRMENAIIIKIAARELLVQTTLCKHMKLNHHDHLQLLRNEIEQFRILYLEWVKSFDPNNDVKDAWSL
jgi:hypothetical protein